MAQKRGSDGSPINRSSNSSHADGNINQANSSKPTRRFECTFEGCGKSYTRAEHLGRHQLNHNPKDIYKCDFPGCTRIFVRQDLCVRHRERHDAPPSRSTDANSTDDDEVEAVTRRVGRPRLSSLSRNGSARHIDRLVHDTTPDAARSSVVDTANNVTGLPQLQSPPILVSNRSQDNSMHSFPTSMHNQQQGQPAMRSTSHNLLRVHNQDYGLPTFPETFNESPASVRDEFTAWLFDEQFANPNGPFFTTSMNTLGTIGDFMPFGSNPMFSDLNDDALLNDFGLESATSTSDLEIITSDDIAWVSSSKRLKLVELMRNRFIDAENKDLTSLRSDVFAGDIDAEDHVLSLRSMQLYLGSYWKHFHRQMPILHQPTFSADAANDLLVLAVMAIGASQLGSRHGKTKTTAASQFATFVAWHLRWQIFMHADFRPPAKLWVFQTLLLLEIYEKVSSTRQMHERAHVHSATMINLMRRGMTLIGDDESGRRTPGPSTPDEAWHRWIETESTRRAAFAAFVIDATHAVMFGHAGIMVVHELRLPLPCDDALWSATSAAEVGRVHASLHTHGIKPTSFLEGLKKTLTGKKVKTNTFGRNILMAGLLSITWHLAQRDLQVSSLGASASLGATPGIWREALAKSFDFWKRDFDESMSHLKNTSLAWHQVPTSEERDASAAASVLHHLSHITLHIDILDCQVFTGATKLFGRNISRGDYERAKHKILEWVKTSAARSAAFHALQLLKSVVLASFPGTQEFFSCRDDYLLNRSWAIYYSLLVLFTYGFALDDVLRPFPTHLQSQTADLPSPQMLWSQVQTPTESLFQARMDDARMYLNTVGSAKSPDDLRMMQSGRNRLVGLFSLFSTSFQNSRWELLQEGAKRLDKAIDILRDGGG
ncbi:hypothetical protein H2198_001482 [Neophaeococcomyces mojaviensis]|uniref:Uncharacterized protein n=1 Tax=Neophaeococcomyces mojaviensis TaxID=3383035 RepID=A0ACC3AHA4_9EURO|nr:hypothetical protein H2198_001482 [Knufia sp. JES_112]